MPRVIDYINDKNNNFYSIGNTLYYQILIGMKLLDPKMAKDELKNYGLYDFAKENYKRITKNVQDTLPKFPTTNEYYKSL